MRYRVTAFTRYPPHPRPALWATSRGGLSPLPSDEGAEVRRGGNERTRQRANAETDFLGAWVRLIDPPLAPQTNMERDLQWAEAVRRQGRATAVLRIYRWDRPALSIGRTQALDDLPSSVRDLKLPVVRRPTGGGAVVHRLDEITYALAVSDTGQIRRCLTPRGIHERLREQLLLGGVLQAADLWVADSGHAGPVSVCFHEPVAGDLIYRGKKAAGAARRVWREGLLIQGALQDLPVPDKALVECLTRAVSSCFDTGGMPNTVARV